MESILKWIAQGEVGVVAILALAWWKEWKDRQRVEDRLLRTTEAIDAVNATIANFNQSIAVLLDRQGRL